MEQNQATTEQQGAPSTEQQREHLEIRPDNARQRLRADIENRFVYHQPIGNQIGRYQQLRDKAKELALLISDLAPISREQSLAITKLEESIFFANAAIARNEG